MEVVLIYSQTCIRAGEVAISEMNSEEFANCQGNGDDLADTFGDCIVLDRESAKLWATEDPTLPTNFRGDINLRMWRIKSGKNALEYFGMDKMLLEIWGPRCEEVVVAVGKDTDLDQPFDGQCVETGETLHFPNPWALDIHKGDSRF